MNIKTKKAAMFGLDARIALAIFGALSVISGAALYSAIQNAKATALLTEIQEIGKALEAYILDTSNDIEISSNNISTYAARELTSSNQPNWKGPYLSYKKQSSSPDTHFTHKSYDRIAIDMRTSAEDGFKECSIDESIGKTCYYWIFFGVVPDNLIVDIDKKVDGNNSPLKGIIYNNPENDGIYYRYMPTIKQYR